MLKEKIRLTAIVGLLMILFNCCSPSSCTRLASVYETVDEVTRVIRKGVESQPKDSTGVQYWK